MPAAQVDVNWKAFGDEAVRMLSELLQIDTTNPPGNEYKAAQYLQKLLEREGVKAELLEKEKGRTNLLARLKGKRPGKKLVLLSHTDVVPVTDTKKWKYPPFSGAVAEGYIWGRGALDMKCMTVMETLVFSLFKRSNLDFAGELILVAAADEEKGSVYGADWLCQAHPDQVKADWALNEGGGMPVLVNGKTFYPIDNVEKGLWWMRLRVKGRSGHGSLPHDDNAVAKSAHFIDRIAHYKFPKRVAPAVREFLSLVLGALGPRAKALTTQILDENQDVEISSEMLTGTPLSAPLLNSLTHTAISPTMIQAGVKENVIPDSCEFVLDCRFVPGYSREKVQEIIMQVAGEMVKDIELETIQHHPVSESPLDNEFYRLIEEMTRAEIPGALTTPLMLTGATDSRFVRPLGTAAYGFCPLSTKMNLADREKLIHNDNERIDVESMELGTRVLAKIAMRALQAK